MYVFISYSSKNLSDAKALKALLEKNGIKVWMAPDSIPIGKNYMSEITPAIENSGGFILLLTEESEKSFYVLSEVSIATGTLPGRIFPISKGYMPRGALRFPFQTVQIKNVRKIDEEDADLRETIRFIREKLTKENAVESLEPQSFQSMCVSVLGDGRFMYLGKDDSQFSADRSACVMYDREEGDAVIVHLSGLSTMGRVKCDPGVMASAFIQPSPDCNYLLVYKDERIWIADLQAGSWIIRNRRLNTRRDGKLLYFSWGQADSFFLLCGKPYKNRNRISCITELSFRTQQEKRTDATSLSLFELVGSRKLDGTDWAVYAAEDHTPVAVDFEKMRFCSPAWEILERVRTRVPVSSGNIDCLSPDGKTFYTRQDMGESGFANVYDTKDRALLLRLPLQDVGGGSPF